MQEKEYCAKCGHECLPVINRTHKAQGRTLRFCDIGCLREWLAEHETDAQFERQEVGGKDRTAQAVA